MPTRVFFSGAPPKPYEGINFGLYQTLYQYLNSITASEFEVVIVDEAHHSLAHGFRTCVERLQPKYLLGMTATPWRSDDQSMDELFGKPIAEVSIVDGMKMGFLAKVDYRMYCDNIDWDAIPKLTRGQMSIRDLNRRLFVPQRDDALIAEIRRVASTLQSPRIIVFCASIEHSNRFAELMSLAGISCRALSGVDKITRNRHLMEFTAGKITAVTAVDVLNEGIDVPDANLLVFLRCTHSRRIFIQQLGRGLRINDRKKSVLVLDFVADIRRIAEVLEMDAEARAPKQGIQRVYFKDGIVTFNDQKSHTFFAEWVADIASLSGEDDSAVLKFP
jgi:superfamily II DNA or RNA helicase